MLTPKPFAQTGTHQDSIVLRSFANHGGTPIVVTMTPTEALALAIDLTNKARVILERAAP